MRRIAARTARLLLARTIAMSPRDVTHLALEQGPDAVRDRTRRAVSRMLGGGAQPDGVPAEE